MKTSVSAMAFLFAFLFASSSFAGIGMQMKYRVGYVTRNNIQCAHFSWETAEKKVCIRNKELNEEEKKYFELAFWMIREKAPESSFFAVDSLDGVTTVYFYYPSSQHFKTFSAVGKGKDFEEAAEDLIFREKDQRKNGV